MKTETEIDWASLLAILSSEKSLAYWQKLRLPIQMDEYKETIRFAKAGLELIMYPSLFSQRNCPINKSWERCRNVGEIVELELLEKHQWGSTYNVDLELMRGRFKKLGKLLDFDKSMLIFDWAIEMFRTDYDTILESGSRLEFILDRLQDDCDDFFNEFRFLSAFEKEIRLFSSRVTKRIQRLQKHFLIAEEVYEMTLPSDWEMLLQDYFASGYRGSYNWMSPIEHSLNFINFFERWKDLTKSIGIQNKKILVDCLEKSFDKLPKSFWLLQKEDLERLRLL